jgi:hypothetical protein
MIGAAAADHDPSLERETVVRDSVSLPVPFATEIVRLQFRVVIDETP